MGEQQSKKTGVKSEAQKLSRAREGYDPLPASEPVSGAFGKQQSERQTDQDLALSQSEKYHRERQTEG
jgi:hypothetical protein